MLGVLKYTLITSVEDGKNPTVIGVCAYPSKVSKGVVVNIDDATSAILESVTAAEKWLVLLFLMPLSQSMVSR